MGGRVRRSVRTLRFHSYRTEVELAAHTESCHEYFGLAEIGTVQATLCLKPNQITVPNYARENVVIHESVYIKQYVSHSPRQYNLGYSIKQRVN
jgi:hypothetical protein